MFRRYPCCYDIPYAQFTASAGKKPYVDSKIHVQGPDFELHPNFLKASFNIFQVKTIYRTLQMKKVKMTFGSKVKPISTAGPEPSPIWTRR